MLLLSAWPLAVLADPTAFIHRTAVVRSRSARSSDPCVTRRKEQQRGQGRQDGGARGGQRTGVEPVDERGACRLKGRSALCRREVRTGREPRTERLLSERDGAGR